MNNRYIFSTVAACLLAGAAMAQSASNPLADGKLANVGGVPGLQNAAGKALQNFQGLLDPSDASGAPLAGQAAPAPKVLGVPKRDFFIRLDALQAFKEGDNVEDLLVDSKQVHYPVFANNKVCGSITLIGKDASWSMVSIGESELARYRQSAINASVKRFQKPETEHFIVRVPALGLEFTAFRDANNALQLSSVAENADAGLIAGEAEAATRVIARLAPLAKNYKGIKPPK